MNIIDENFDPFQSQEQFGCLLYSLILSFIIITLVGVGIVALIIITLVGVGIVALIIK
jgi:hypothetical protein